MGYEDNWFYCDEEDCKCSLELSKDMPFDEATSEEGWYYDRSNGEVYCPACCEKKRDEMEESSY